MASVARKPRMKKKPAQPRLKPMMKGMTARLKRGRRERLENQTNRKQTKFADLRSVECRLEPVRLVLHEQAHWSCKGEKGYKGGRLN